MNEELTQLKNLAEELRTKWKHYVMMIAEMQEAEDAVFDQWQDADNAFWEAFNRDSKETQ